MNVGLAVLAMLCSGSALRAQSVVRVLDRDSVPIPWALVQVKGGTERVVDSLGRVRFSTELPATATLQVRRLGYVPFSGPVARGARGEYAVLLEPVQRELEAVRTVAPRSTTLSRTGFYDRMQRVHTGAIVGTFITPEELERRSPSQISQMLFGLPSLRVQRLNSRQFAVLGRGGCPMTVLLDGVRINGLVESPRENLTSISQRSGSSIVPGTLSIDEIAAAQEIMAIEVYNSTANAPSELIPLTGGGSCGIVALWTGPRR
jgi:hypothetical protein